MYGLIHKLKNKKKKKNGKQYSKAITTKTKDKHTRFGFALYSCFLLRNVLVVNHRNQLLSSGVWFGRSPI